MYVQLTGQMTGECQLLMSPHQFEGEGDKRSHKNTASVISHFLGRMVHWNRSKPWMNLHIPPVCVCLPKEKGIWEKQRIRRENWHLLKSNARPWVRQALYKMLCLVTHSHPTLCNPMDCSPPGSSAHGDSSDKNTGVGYRALLQGIFPTQVSLITGGFFTIWVTRVIPSYGASLVVQW